MARDYASFTTYRVESVSRINDVNTLVETVKNVPNEYKSFWSDFRLSSCSSRSSFLRASGSELFTKLSLSRLRVNLT